jgi:hypothetical protein
MLPFTHKNALFQEESDMVPLELLREIKLLRLALLQQPFISSFK